MWRRRIRTQSEWKVEISGFSWSCLPIIAIARCCISPAALLVKVTARMRCGRDAMTDQVGDPRGDRLGLARAGAGQHQQGPRQGVDDLALGRIEIHLPVGSCLWMHKIPPMAVGLAAVQPRRRSSAMQTATRKKNTQGNAERR